MSLWRRLSNGNLLARLADGTPVTVFKTFNDTYKYVCEDKFSDQEFDDEEECCEAAEELIM